MAEKTLLIRSSQMMAAGSAVSIKKTYTLSSPVATSDETGFDMAGTGSWVFDRTTGVSESMDMLTQVGLLRAHSRPEVRAEAEKV